MATSHQLSSGAVVTRYGRSPGRVGIQLDVLSSGARGSGRATSSGAFQTLTVGQARELAVALFALCSGSGDDGEVSHPCPVYLELKQRGLVGDELLELEEAGCIT